MGLVKEEVSKHLDTLKDVLSKNKHVNATELFDIIESQDNNWAEDLNKESVLRRLRIEKNKILNKKTLNKTDTKNTLTKKEPKITSWRDISTHIKSSQKFKQDTSSYQEFIKWKPNVIDNSPVALMVLGDTQLGSFGTDYELFEELTDFIVNTPNLYVILVGDLIQLAIKLRNVAEILDNAISPRVQMVMLESWLDEIKHKVIASTWCNHGTMREETMLGYSPSAKMMSTKVPFFNTIGEIEATVGDQTYMIAASHFFQGKSMYNKAHAPMRYIREKANHIDIAIQGDFHQPGILLQPYGGKLRLGVVCGSIQTNSTYAKRHFAVKTFPQMPVITLDPNKKNFNCYINVEAYLNR